jgi:hypothetical protein
MKKNEKGKMLSGVMRRPSLTTITWRKGLLGQQGQKLQVK